jgi:hypothetical protein
MAKLTILDHVPAGLLGCDSRDLAEILQGPTLIHLPGRRPEPLFVSVLLHGNEQTGFEAVRRVLLRHQSEGLPRALSLFIGNVAAASAGVRTLGQQRDYNRAWPGAEDRESPEAALLGEVTDAMAAAKPFASIDIHNNTGTNPHYACVNRLDHRFFHLALLFSRTVVYFERPLGVQSAAFAPLCPAVTLECGQSGAVGAAAHAAQMVDDCLHLSHFPEHSVDPRDIDLIRTFAIVKVPGDVTFSFDETPAEFCFRGDIDHLNFSALAPGVSLGIRAPGSEARLEIVAASNPPDAPAGLDDCFDYEGGEIRLVRSVIPAMLTRDADAVRLDCLGYLMHRIGMDGKPVAVP